jgi:hypothetical protein
MRYFIDIVIAIYLAITNNNFKQIIVRCLLSVNTSYLATMELSLKCHPIDA